MPASPTSTKSGASPEELHAEAFVKCDRPLICRRGYRFDVLATMPPSELLEAAEKLTREALPTGGPPDSNRMNISNRFGLREKAKQISEDLSPVANDKRRVSKLMNEEWMVQVASVPCTPEFMHLIENLVVVLVGTHRNFCGTAHRRSAGIVTTRIRIAVGSHQMSRELSIWRHAGGPTVAVKDSICTGLRHSISAVCDHNAQLMSFHVPTSSITPATVVATPTMCAIVTRAEQ